MCYVHAQDSGRLTPLVGNLDRDQTNPQDVVAYITGAKTGEEYAGAA